MTLLTKGAVAEACFQVADAADPVAAREEVRVLIVRCLEGLRVPNTA
jgi:hypothetical protein